MLSPLLTAEPFAPCAGTVARLLKALQPLLLIALLLWHGALAALVSQLRAALAGAPAQLLRPAAWRDALLARAMPVLLAASDEMWAPVKRDLVAHARGDVLEVGAGSGMTLKYYRRSEVRRVGGAAAGVRCLLHAITRTPFLPSLTRAARQVSSLVLLEPFAELHPPLRSAIAEHGLADVASLVPHGVHERSALAKAGVRAASFDTVVLVQVLCSIPEPQAHLAYLQSLLRPGGRLLLFEHVGSASRLTRAVQRAWTYPLWRFAAAGCCLDRDSGVWLAQLGGWKHVELLRPASEDDGDVVPHAVGIFTKA